MAPREIGGSGVGICGLTVVGRALRIAGCLGESVQMKEEEKVDASVATVLVVDDNKQNLELLLAYLEDVDCRTIAATSGVEAINIVGRTPPDLILLDVMMPKMSGFEVCKRLKSDAKTADIPIIMVTALNELGDIERAINCGTDDFLSKPVNKWELITRVRTMLKLKHLTDKLERTLAYLSEVESQVQPRRAQ
jgi:two-component system alkaline phosphatase synthesis response regulator PhoP